MDVVPYLLSVPVVTRTYNPQYTEHHHQPQLIARGTTHTQPPVPQVHPTRQLNA
jgi:hypothetical protein